MNIGGEPVQFSRNDADRIANGVRLVERIRRTQINNDGGVDLPSVVNPSDEVLIVKHVADPSSLASPGVVGTDVVPALMLRLNGDVTGGKYYPLQGVYPYWMPTTVFTATTSWVINPSDEKTYQCSTSHTSGASFDSTKWTQRDPDPDCVLYVPSGTTAPSIGTPVTGFIRGVRGDIFPLVYPNGNAVASPQPVWVKVTSTTMTGGAYPAVLATPHGDNTFTDSTTSVTVSFPDGFVPAATYYAALPVSGTIYEGIPAPARLTQTSLVTNVCATIQPAMLLFAADPPSTIIPVWQNYGVVSAYTPGEILSDPKDVIRAVPGTSWNDPLYQYMGALPHTCGATFNTGSDKIGGFISSITLTAGGSDYIANPSVSIASPYGAGASATAVESGGVVTSLTLVSGGLGYLVTNVPLVGISPQPISPGSPIAGPGSGAQATVTVDPNHWEVYNNDTQRGVVSAITVESKLAKVGDPSAPSCAVNPINCCVASCGTYTFPSAFRVQIYATQEFITPPITELLLLDTIIRHFPPNQNFAYQPDPCRWSNYYVPVSGPAGFYQPSDLHYIFPPGWSDYSGSPGTPNGAAQVQLSADGTYGTLTLSFNMLLAGYDGIAVIPIYVFLSPCPGGECPQGAVMPPVAYNPAGNIFNGTASYAYIANIGQPSTNVYFIKVVLTPL